MSKRRIVGAAIAAVALAAGACTNSSNTSATGSDGGAAKAPATTRSAAELNQNIPSTQPGVTDTEIRVSSIGAITNLLGADYTQAPNGTKAFFEMINSQGGIYGRKLVLVDSKDDQMTKNKDIATGIVADNDVFAVLPVTTVLFTGAQELADGGIPTYGWNINAEWAGNASLFGEKGSFICIECGSPQSVWVAKKAGATKVGLMAYGVDQSKTCADGTKSALEKGQGPPIAFTDDTIAFGSTDYTVQVQKLKDSGADFIMLCTDLAGAVNLGKELNKQNLDIPMYLPNAYEPDTLTQFAAELDGSYVGTAFAALESDPLPKGLQDYKTWIAKVPGAKAGEQSVTGWLNADLFYRGLVAAGPEFTRRSVVEATNQITEWTADGAIPAVNWTTQHEQQNDPACFSLTQIKDGKFVPAFTEPGKPFVCIPVGVPVPDEPERR